MGVRGFAAVLAVVATVTSVLAGLALVSHRWYAFAGWLVFAQGSWAGTAVLCGLARRDNARRRGTPGMDIIALHDGRVLQVHGADRCATDRCCVHRPSDHSLNTAPLHWDVDRRRMMRVCPHGEFHPDPDDLLVRLGLDGPTHEPCDGCCVGAQAKA